MKVLKIIVFILPVLFVINACEQDPKFPDEPTLKFNSLVEKVNENGLNVAELYLDFTDGDGNLGLSQADTLGVNCLETCYYYWNLFAEYYEKRDGVWTHIPIDWLNGQVPFYYRIPEVNPTGQNPSLEGQIKIDMDFYYLPSAYDTCRFQVQIVDRDLNLSNVVNTREFIKP